MNEVGEEKPGNEEGPREDEGKMEEIDIDDEEVPATCIPCTEPCKPTKKEIEEHAVTHLPFRSWCPQCVMGKAKDDPHRKVEQEVKEAGMPIVTIDYMYLGKRGESESKEEYESKSNSVPTIVMRCHRTKSTFAHVCKNKGASDTWIVKRLAKDIDSLGYGAVILRSDNEPAIIQLQEAIKNQRNAHTKCENSEVGDSRANGVAEKAVQEVKGQVRTMLIALEKKLDEKIGEGLPVLEWMVEYSALLISRYAKGSDGKTPVERLRGRISQRPLAEFGETVMHRIQKKPEKLSGLETRWEPGVWLGISSRTNEAVIAVDEGVVKCRTVRRVKEEDKWNVERVKAVKGRPRAPDPNKEGDDRIPVSVHIPQAQGQPPQEPQAPEELTRIIYIKKTDVETYGKTPGCPGCESMGRGVKSKNVQEKA